MTDDIASLERQITDLRARQRTVEEQIARFGGYAPSHLILEREEIERNLADAERRLDNLRLLPSAGRVPYLGLQTFGEDSADLYFGRDDLIAELVERARRAALLAVLGASGSGKSSVVRAGLVPRLKGGALPGSETWRYSILKPGDRPLDTLAAELTRLHGGDLAAALDLAQRLAGSERALLQAADVLLDRARGQRLVLVVDQCEELWTLAPADQTQRTAWIAEQQGPFVQLLLRAAASPDSPVLVVLTMRADFLHRAAEHPALARAIGDHDIIVSPMEENDLRAAIVEPARRQGVGFEHGLVEELVRQVQGRPGALPLLEYTLLELWKRRDTALMTWDAYRRIGGLEGALASRADEVVDSYTPQQREALRQVLLRLVQPGEGAADTRRRVPLTDLAADADDSVEVQALLKPLTDERLLTVTRERPAADANGAPPTAAQVTVEVTHEALIRAWPTLGRWIGEARADLRAQLQVEQAAKEWQASGELVDLLWSGLRLSNAEAWLARARPRLNERERRFLDASHAAAQAQQQKEQQARRQQIRLLGFAVVVSLFAAAAAVFGLIQVRQNAQQAQQSVLQAQRQGLASAAQAAHLMGDYDQALALALAAIAKAPDDIPDEVIPTIYHAADAGARRRFAGHISEVTSVAFSPDGRTALSGSSDGSVRLWDLASGQQLHQFSGHTHWVYSVAFSPDGRTALSGSSDGTMRLWDVASGQELRQFSTTTNLSAPTSVVFSPDGTQALSTATDASIRLWDVASGQELRQFSGHISEVTSVAFSPDGQTALSGAYDGIVRLWDVASGQELRQFSSTERVHSVAFSPDGTQALSGARDGIVQLWDVASGQELRQFRGHTDRVMSVAFSPDGRTVLSGDGFGTVRLWGVDSGQELRQFSGHTGEVASVAFSPDGRTALSGSDDRTMRLWDVTSGQELRQFSSHTHWVYSVAFSPDGRTVLSGSQDRAVQLWDVASGQELRQFSGHTHWVYSVAFSPDGRTALSGSSDGSVRLWDLASGQELHQFSGHTHWVYSVAFSPDGRTVLSGDGFGTVRLWGVDSGQELRQFSGHTGEVASVAFSPDGRTVLSGSYDRTVRLWDVASGQELRQFSGHTDWVRSVAFSPDGRTALSGSHDRTVRLWDVASGQELRQFSGHTGEVASVAFSPDGRTVLSGSGDGSVRLWQVASGQELRQFSGRTDWVYSVAFSPDGRTVLSGSADGTMRLWRTDTVADLVAFVKENRYVPELPCAQRALYNVEPLCATEPTAVLPSAVPPSPAPPSPAYP